MKKLFVFFVLILSSSAYAQIPEPAMLWLKSYGGNSNIASLVTPQLDGGFIICLGAGTSSGNIDSFCSLTGIRSIFLEFNSDASILDWTKCYEQNDSSFSCMFSTIDGDYVLGGLSNGTTYEFLIHKETATGIVLWSKTYGDSASAILKSMIATNDGGYIMCGQTSYTNSDFPVHYGSWMDEDIAVIKVDSNGNKVWSEVIGGTLGINFSSLVAGPENGCYIVGTTFSDDYDCIGNHGGDDVYLVRLDGNGNILWHDDIGGSGGDQGNCAVADGKGGVIIAGASNSLNGDRTVFPSFGCPIWALEVDSNEHILWDNCYGGGGNDCWPNAICKATDGSIWIAGVSSTQGAEVDTNYGLDDAWFVHTDDTGNLLNTKVLGSSSDDAGMMVYPLSNSNVIAGGFSGANDGSFSYIPWNGYMNSFLTIFEPHSTKVTTISMLNNSIKFYPNPTNEQVTIESGQKGNYEVVITDLLGMNMFKSNFHDELQIQVKGWQAGIYFVQVISESGYQEIQKLIVQ